MIKSILLPVDGSAYTEAVLQYGIHFAKKFDAHLRVLTVVDVRIFEWSVAIGVEGFAPVIPSTAYQEESQKLLNDRADEVLKKSEKILQKENVDYSLEKESGNPVDIICDQTRLVDLVVIGARGEFARWSDKMLGVTLEAITRLCIKPVFVSPRKYHPLKKILIAYDGSEVACKALTLAAFFASTMKLPLQVLVVNNSREESRSLLDEAREYLNSYHLPKVEELHRTGDPDIKIVEVSNETGTDLIIIGSYGHSRIREAILGSTTVQVMRHAEVPILMAR